MSNFISKQHNNKTQRKEEVTQKQMHLNKLTFAGIKKRAIALLMFALAWKNPLGKENKYFQNLKYNFLKKDRNINIVQLLQNE